MSSNTQKVRPLLQYIEEFEEYYLAIGRSKITLRNVKSSLKFFESHLGIKTIEDANSPKLVKDAMIKCKNDVIGGKTRGNVACNSYLKNLKIYMRWLFSMDYIKENKTVRVYKFRECAKKQPTLTDIQVNRAIKHIVNREQNALLRYRNELCIRLFALIGLRPEELIKIKHSDIYVYKDIFKIELVGAKGGDIRPYAFTSKELRHTYQAYMGIREKLGRYEDELFISSTNLGPWTKSGLRRLFTALSKELGFKVTGYPFRRYVATKLHNEGLSLFEIQKHMGHKKTSTTLRYIERSSKFTEKSSGVMEKAIKNCLNLNKISKGKLRRQVMTQLMINKRVSGYKIVNYE